MKKCISIVTVLALLMGLCACNVMQGGDTTASTELPLSDPKPLEQLAVEHLDGDQFGGIGAIIIYEDEERVIFFTEYGLFAYDLAERKMLFSVDHVKAYGTTGSVQGETGTYAATSPDGMEIVLYYTAPNQVFDAYYIDVASMTWRTGEFRDLDEVFDRYSLVEGEVNPGVTIKEAYYERDGEVWDVFAEYFD